MKKIALLSAMTLLATLANPVQAADSPLKQNMINACTSQMADKNITDPASAQKVCGCVVTTQLNITQAQKDEVDNWVKSGKNLQDNTTYQSVVAKMKACGNGIKFNK